jgi:RNA polymerase sigma-70 factor (ECF subfamily)
LHVESGDTTDPLLLERLGDWSDQDAWREFVRRYEPVIRGHCASYRFPDDVMDDLCQGVWIELARRMKSYRYDPSLRFRSWLRKLCRWRAIEVYRKRVGGKTVAGGDIDPAFEAVAHEVDDDDSAEPETGRPELLAMAERVQEAVRRRVEDRTWRVFWSIAVENVSIPDAAAGHGLTYAAAFAAQQRVRRMLREEGRRLGADVTR